MLWGLLAEEAQVEEAKINALKLFLLDANVKEKAGILIDVNPSHSMSFGRATDERGRDEQCRTFSTGASDTTYAGYSSTYRR
jgi:hypothetical protein